MIAKTLKSLFVFSLFFSFTTVQAATIDEFEETQILAQNVVSVTVNSQADAASAIGGKRGITATKFTPPANPARFVRYGSNFGEFSFSNDVQVTGSSTITWDGDLNPGLTANGLGGINLLQDNATAFVLGVISCDLCRDDASLTPPVSVRITITAYDASDPSGFKYSQRTFSIPNPIGVNTNYVLPFSSFTTSGANGAASFSNIGAITMQIDGFLAELDLAIDFLKTDGTCPSVVPAISGPILNECLQCLGTPLSCLDCSGTPFGTKVYDICGVCDGDGTSCINCTTKDLSKLQTALDGGAKKQERLIKQIVKKLTLLSKKKAIKDLAAVSLARAHELQIRNWILSWTIPSLNKQCIDSVACSANTANQVYVNEYQTHNQELYKLASSLIRKVQALSSKKAVQSFISLNTKLFKENLALSKQVPTKHYSCIS